MYLLVFIALASAFKIEMKLAAEEVMKINQTYMVNSFKTKLIKFPDERGYSMIATEPIKRDEHILAVVQPMCPTSFDQYPWYHLFVDVGHEI